jgi:mannobiose 2-epimerase
MNTHIHLLEAFTGLHEVWPDPVLHRRLEELFQIVRDKIVVEPGCQCLYFNLDWRPVPDLDSFGHDIETAYLLTEAAAALDKPEDAAAWTAARHLVDHALEFGFDRQRGGFYNEGTTFGRDVTKEKIWWVEAEGLNALLLMHERFGRETAQYWDAFVKQWDFISQHQIDATHGGWYPTLGADGQPKPNQPKSDRWTEGYHQGRALMNVSDRLRKLAGSDAKAKSVPDK